jgi:hypothetical protein
MNLHLLIFFSGKGTFLYHYFNGKTSAKWEE